MAGSPSIWFVLFTLLALGPLAVPSGSRACCNVIPAATLDFRAALGSTNRPFASPGDFVEVRVVPAICDRTSTGFSDVDQDGAKEDDHVITVLFVPPGGGDANAVVLAEDCTGATATATADCDTALGAGTAQCVPVNGMGQPLGLTVLSSNELQFRFPDTDARLAPDGDDRSYSGPAKIVVTRVGASLQCSLAAARCADLGGDTTSNGVVACVDELYALDGTCRDSSSEIDETFGYFTALPPPNDYEALVNQPGITEFRLTTDAAGNLLAPMDYKGVLLRVNDVPLPQLVRLATDVDAFSASPGQPVALPGDGPLDSFSPEGVVLPQVFSPLRDPSSSGCPGIAPTCATLFGAMDAPRAVLRVGRQACVGGTNEGDACASGAQCGGGGTCTALFDFSDRYVSGVGPVVLPGGPTGNYLASLESPVPFEGLIESSQTFDFVLSEALDGIDRNGDGDPLPKRTDFVATLRGKDTGLVQPIGPGGAEGRAAVRVRQGSFAFPAVATEADLLVFLESEPAQGNTDINANGAVSESALRAYRLGVTTATEVTDPLDLPTVDAAPRLGNRAVVASGDSVFFRTREAGEADRETTRVSLDSGGTEGNGTSQNASISADGRTVAFGSSATNLVAGDSNAQRDVFVHDRDTGTTTRVSVSSGSAEGNALSLEPSLSADGRIVAFASAASNLVAGDANGVTDIFVHDRDTVSTTRVSVDSGGTESDATSGAPSISANGRYVAFESFATNLVAGDTNALQDVFVHDRNTGDTIRVSVDSGGAQGNGASFDARISADGSSVVFLGSGSNLVTGDTNGVDDIFVHDLGTDTTHRVSVDSSGTQANGASSFDPTISGNGRAVAFYSAATNLVAGDTNSQNDTFVHDRDTGLTTRVSVDSGGIQGNQESRRAAISTDGRSVAFYSEASNLVPGDLFGFADLFVHDRSTGATTRISLDSSGTQANAFSAFAAISADGRTITFESSASNLVAGDGNFSRDIFVRGIDVTDLPSDRTGDGLLDDTVLRVLDASVGPPGSVTDLCPAELAAVSAGRAAFLRPEAAGATSSCGVSSGATCLCSGGSLDGPDLNGDLDQLDSVLHLYDGSTVENLRCAATDLALSSTRLAALVSEADEDATILNADGDTDDLVLHVRGVGASAPTSCAHASWTNVGEAGDDLDLWGDVVALVTPEADQGAGSLNGDGDTSDRVIRLVDGTNGTLIPIVDDQLQPDDPQAAEEFVLGSSLAAFRTLEADQGNTDLNGDGDMLDGVLQIYILATGERINTGQAVVPCELAACDPRRPYRVSQDTVRFLTFESEQAEDLNDDGDQLDLLVQVFNVQSRLTQVVAEVADTGATAEAPETGFDPLAAPAPEGDSSGEQVVVTVGRCVEDTGVSCTAQTDCDLGEFCFPETGTRSCVRDTGRTCLPDAAVGERGCSAEASCEMDFVALGVADTDGDELPEGLDNCPETSNVDQADLDGDGVGDACDLQTCSNGGAPELDEECDDGNLVDGDGCDSNCRTTACGNGIVTTGEQCDDGNALSDDGCSATCVVEFCGNGLIDGGEQCDDGNTSDGDCCSASCQFQGAHGVGGMPNCCFEGTCQVGQACGAICFTSGAACIQAGGAGTTCTCELP